MPTPFVVYASMRTGSRWLVELLDSHPGAAVYSEAFLANGEGSMTSSGGPFPYFVTYLAARRVRRPLVLQRVRYLRAFFRHVPDVRAVGFKLMYGQAERNPGVLHYSALRRIRTIHVVRRNALRAVVSHRVAVESGSFHPRRGDAVRQVRITLDVATLADELGRREASVQGARYRLARLRLPVLEVSYEGLVDERDATLASILEFLGLDPPPLPLETTLTRAVTSLGDVVANFDAVRDALSATPFAWMADEP